MDKKRIGFVVLAAFCAGLIYIPSAQAFDWSRWMFWKKTRSLPAVQQEGTVPAARDAKIRPEGRAIVPPTEMVSTAVETKLGVVGENGIEVFKRTSSTDLSKTNLIFRVAGVDYPYSIRSLGTYTATDGNSVFVFDENDKKFFIFRPGDSNAPGGTAIKIQAFDGVTGQAVPATGVIFSPGGLGGGEGNPAGVSPVPNMPGDGNPAGVSPVPNMPAGSNP